MTAREIEAVPVRTAEDALRLVPGITLVQHGSEGKGYQFLVRGFDAAHGADFEVTVEGIPVNEWSNVHAQGYLDLGFVIPEVIESVRVVKGPFSLGQGAFAMAGSADYHLGVAEEDRGLRTAYTVGTTGRHRGLITYSPESGNGHSFVASETLHDDGFGENRSIDRASLLGRTVLFQSSRHGTLSLLGAAYVARFELPTPVRNEDVAAGRIGFYDTYDPLSHGMSARSLSALNFAWTRGRRALRAQAYAGYRRLQLLENFTGYLLDPIWGDRRSQQHGAWSVGASSSYLAPLERHWDAALGFGVRGDWIEQRQNKVSASEALVEEERNVSAEQMLAHALAGLSFEPRPAWRWDAGVRVDVARMVARDVDAAQSGSGTVAALSPRTTLRWHAAEPLWLFAAYGRGFRPPEARAFAGVAPAGLGLTEELAGRGSPDMTSADSVELGARVRATELVTARASAFATYVGRESVFDHVSGTNLELNATRRLGAELVLWSRPSSWLSLQADGTYVDASFVESGNSVPFAPTLFGGLRALVTEPDGWQAGLRFAAIAPRPLPHGARSSSVTQLDGTVGYLAHRWRVDLALENMLGQRIRQGEFHFASRFRTEQPESRIPVLHTFAGPPRNARLTVTAVF